MPTALYRLAIARGHGGWPDNRNALAAELEPTREIAGIEKAAS